LIPANLCARKLIRFPIPSQSLGQIKERPKKKRIPKATYRRRALLNPRKLPKRAKVVPNRVKPPASPNTIQKGR
jgi:hypothetical protein